MLVSMEVFLLNQLTMETPDNLKYTQEHEWVKIDGDTATVGITDFAQSELGDIVYVEVETVDQSLAQNEVFGTVEAVKAVSDLFMPISGTIIAFNEKLEDDSELVNNSPYEDGWMIKIKIENPEELEALMSAEAYKELTNA